MRLIVMCIETWLFSLGPVCVYVQVQWFVILLTMYSVVMSIVTLRLIQ